MGLRQRAGDANDRDNEHRGETHAGRLSDAWPLPSFSVWN